VIVLGVDPGISGGLAFLDGGKAAGLYVMPTYRTDEEKKIHGHKVDFHTFASIVEMYRPDRAVVERVSAMPGQGVSSMFTFGGAYTGVLACLQALSIPYDLVTPQKWKKEMGFKKEKKETVKWCMERYPNVSLIPPRCRTPHSGLADALAIASWALM